MIHDRLDLLGFVLRADQGRVFGVHDRQALHAERRHQVTAAAGHENVAALVEQDLELVILGQDSVLPRIGPHDRAEGRETAEVVEYMKQDSGYVFCNIHNILAEIDPQKVIAMYEAAE